MVSKGKNKKAGHRLIILTEKLVVIRMQIDLWHSGPAGIF
jgi:hypothetical protein